MKKRFLSLLLVVCLMASFASVAWAADDGTTETTETTPRVLSMTVAVGDAKYSAEADENGIMYLPVPGDTSILNCVVSVKTNGAVEFVENTTPPEGALYVKSGGTSSVKLNFNATVGSESLDQDAYSLTMNSSDGVNWIGQEKILTGLLSEIVDIKLSSFATALEGYENLGLAAGSMKFVSSDATSAFWRVICNQDNKNVVLTFCPYGWETYTVTYVCGSTTYVWELPKGGSLVKPEPLLQTGQSFAGWYTDEACTNAVDANATVTDNMTIYANITGTDTASTFSGALSAGKTVLPINDATDWAAFVQRANEVTSTQRVELNTDIICDGATYTALTFAGNFDGKGHTISKATFNANGSNSGMFATIGAGQIIANLTLSDITVNYGENAGVLAGSISATNSSPALIQNVQIRGGTVKGRNMGALVGYTFLSNIKYCSSRDTTFSGLVNAGGIAGISYSVISNCYSTCALSQFSMYKAGIVAKNQEAGRVEWCWTTYGQVIASSHEDSSEENNFESFNDYDNIFAVSMLGFDETYWALAAGDNTQFTDAVYYAFTNSEE